MKESSPLTAPDLPEATVSEHAGVRYLHLGSEWVQGAMRLAAPQRIELEYVQRMMAWMLWRPSEQLMRGDAVQLGLGAGTITRFAHDRLRLNCTAVEINRSVLLAARMWFGLPEDGARLRVQLADAGSWLRETARRACADVLCVDLYDHEAAAPVLDSEDFYAACRALLREGGVMSVNLFGRQASFGVSSARVAHAFGADQTWYLRPTREGNTVVVAARGVVVPGRQEMLARAANIERLFSLPARKWLRLVRPWQPIAAQSPTPR